MGAAASMSSRPATMTKVSRAGVTPPCRCLPEEIVIWEILVRVPPKSLLRCRAVCRAWHRATSTRDFLLAHHGRQPSLPIVWDLLVSGSAHCGAHYNDILAFNYRATDAQLQAVVRLDQSYNPEAFCDGILILSRCGTNYRTSLSICNPVTREHSPLRIPLEFHISSFLGMYLHRPTGEYRLLVLRRSHTRSVVEFLLGKSEIGCYVFVLGSDQPPRYIQWSDAASGLHLGTPAMVRDNLHWFPAYHQSERKPVIMFDTTAESFRQMCAPVVPTNSNIFEMDDTLGIYSYSDDMKVADIWVLQNYEDMVWEQKYCVGLPIAEIRGQPGRREDRWYVHVFSVDGDILLLLSHGGWLFYVNIDGELVDSFHHDGQHLSANGFFLKQTLVPHNFFRTLEDNVVNASPFL